MKLNVMVMFGGKSTEHEVSIISAIQAIENMDREKYNIIPIYISKSGDFYYHKNLLFDIKNFRDTKNLLSKCKKVEIVRKNKKVYIEESKCFFKNLLVYIDIAFPIVHGTNVEDGNLQGFLHTFDIPVVGCDVTSSAVGMDKYVMKQFLKSEGINVINAKRYDINDYKKIDSLIQKIEKEFSYPLIIKPTNLGSSIGINKVKNRESLLNAIEVAFSFSNLILVERAIVDMKEINCSVLGDRFEAISSTLEEPIGNGDILDFSDKYLSNKKGKTSKIKKVSYGNKNTGMASLSRKIPAEIDKKTEEEIKQTAIKVFKLLGCSGVSRIDFIMDTKKNEVYVNEINTIPGSLSFYLWETSGIKYIELIDRLIDIAKNNYRREKNLNFVFDSNILK